MTTINARSRTLASFATFGLATLCLSTGAEAHVSFTSATASPDATVVLQLQVPHGCGGKPTNEVQVKLPAGFYGAKPQPKAGWTLEIIKGDYAKPIDNHGTTMTSGALEIRWKGGNLPDDNYDTFVIQGRIAGVEAGKSLAFPTVQLCGTDTQKWDQVAAPGADAHSLKNPAPQLTVAEGDTAGDHDMHAGMDMSGMKMNGDTEAKADTSPAATATQASLTLSGGFLKAMLPGQPVGGGYLSIANAGSSDDRLLSVTSARAEAVEMHEMAMNGDVMTMRKLDKGIVIPAGQTIELKPGGLHLMFMKVAQPFKMGDTVPVTFTFEKAGKIELQLPVESAAPGAHKHK